MKISKLRSKVPFKRKNYTTLMSKCFIQFSGNIIIPLQFQHPLDKYFSYFSLFTLIKKHKIFKKILQLRWGKK